MSQEPRSEERSEGRMCGAQYGRPGGRQRGDRIVRCSMHLHHSGNHVELYEGKPAVEWPEEPPIPHALCGARHPVLHYICTSAASHVDDHRATFGDDTEPFRWSSVRSWSLPPEPGPEVTKLRDVAGRTWERGTEISSEDVELLAEAIFEASRLNDFESSKAARAVLAALAGRLLPAGGVTRTEWGFEDGDGRIVQCCKQWPDQPARSHSWSHSHSRRAVSWAADGPNDNWPIYRGPWLPVEEGTHD